MDPTTNNDTSEELHLRPNDHELIKSLIKEINENLQKINDMIVVINDIKETEVQFKDDIDQITHDLSVVDDIYDLLMNEIDDH